MDILKIHKLVKDEIKLVFGLNLGARKLLRTDWLVLRHNEQIELGAPTTITHDDYIRLLKRRQHWRDEHSKLQTIEAVSIPLVDIHWVDNLNASQVSDVERYTIMYSEGLIPPPITVELRADGKYHIQDGNRRVKTALNLGMETIKAVVYDLS